MLSLKIIICILQYVNLDAVSYSYSSSINKYEELIVSTNKETPKKLKEFASLDILSITNVIDVNIFLHKLTGEDQQLIAVAILFENNKKNLIISKFSQEHKSWKILKQAPTQAVLVMSINVSEGQVLILKESYGGTAPDVLKVLLFDDNLHFKKLQTLHHYNIENIEVSFFINEHFLTFCYYEENNQRNKYCSVFKWRGTHFDLLQKISTLDGKMFVMIIKNSFFLVITNQPDVSGTFRNKAEVYKYNDELQLFEIHQRISNTNPTAVHFFKYLNTDETNYFLMIVNTNEKQVIENILSTISMIYKYTEGYFVPFQSILMPLDVIWLAVEDGLLKLFLIAQGNERINIYQYNGWKFQSVDVSSENLEFLTPSSSVRLKTFPILNNTFIAAINTKDTRLLKFFKPIYVTHSPVNDYHHEIQSWCSNILKLNSDNKLKLKKINVEVEENRSNGFKKLIQLNFSSVQNIITKHLIVPEQHIINQEYLNAMNDVFSVLAAQYNIISKIALNIDKHLNIKDIEAILSSKTSNILIYGENVQFGELIVNRINEIPFNKLKKSFFLLRNSTLGKDVLIENMNANEIKFVEINDMSVQRFNMIISKMLRKSNVTVHGNVFSNSDISVEGNIDSVNFSENSIVLDGISQNIAGKLDISELYINLLQVDQINNIKINDFLSTIKHTNLSINNDLFYKDVIVKSLYLDGYIGTMHINNVLNNTLKRKSSQNLQKDVYVKSLKSSLFSSQTDDILLIANNVNTLKIDNLLKFNKIASKTLNIQEYLNDIPITNSTLPFVFLNSNKTQYINGLKTFENVNISKVIELNDELRNSLLKSEELDKVLNEPLALLGDFKITGKVTILDVLSTTDAINGNVSINDILNLGIRITDQYIDIPVTLRQNVKVENVNTDKLNELKERDLINYMDTEYNILKFEKIAFNNVKVEGSCKGVVKVNDVDLKTFNDCAMRSNIPQEIYGRIGFRKLIIDRIVTNDTIIGKSELNNLVTYMGDYKIASTIIIENDLLVSEYLKTKIVNAKGTVADLNIHDMLFDTLYKGMPKYKLKSKKYFREPLITKTLLPRGNFLNVDAKSLIGTLSWNKNIEISNSLYIEGNILVRNVIFNVSIDGINANEFGKSWLLYEEDQTFTKKQSFDVILAKGIEVKDINGFTSELFKRIIKINDNVLLEKLKVQQLNSKVINISNNRINGINISNILVKNSEYQIVTGMAVFEDGLAVAENIDFNSIRGTDVTCFVNFLASSNECRNTVIVKGKAAFNREPQISAINSTDIEMLNQNVWFLNQDMAFLNPMSFQNINFLEDVTVEGKVNHKNIKKLASTYLSKSADQIITGMSHWSNIEVPVIEVAVVDIENAHITDLGDSIKNYTQNVLFIRGNMIVENLNMTAVEFSDLHIIGHMNGLDMNKDIVLVSETGNKIVSNKEFGNMAVTNLNIEALVNGINFNDWLINAVYKESTVNQQISGLKLIRYIYADEISVSRLLNLNFPGEFLMKHGNNFCNGKKVFYAEQKYITFRNVTIKENLNNFPCRHLKFLINKEDTDITFLNSKYFRETVTANNVIVNDDNGDVSTLKNVLTKNMLDANTLISAGNELRNHIDKYQSDLQYVHWSSSNIALKTIQVIQGVFDYIQPIIIENNLFIVERIIEDEYAIQVLPWSSALFKRGITLWNQKSVIGAWHYDNKCILVSTISNVYLVKYMQNGVNVEQIMLKPIKQAVPIVFGGQYLLILHVNGKLICYTKEPFAIHMEIHTDELVAEFQILGTLSNSVLMTVSVSNKISFWSWSAANSSFIFNRTWKLLSSPRKVAVSGMHLALAFEDEVITFRYNTWQFELIENPKIQISCENIDINFVNTDLILGCLHYPIEKYRGEINKKLTLFKFEGLYGFKYIYSVVVPNVIKTINIFRVGNDHLIMLKSDIYIRISKIYFN